MDHTTQMVDISKWDRKRCQEWLLSYTGSEYTDHTHPTVSSLRMAILIAHTDALSIVVSLTHRRSALIK